MPNRRFQALNKKTQAKMINNFPYLATIISNESAGGDYQHVAISVYDHWLSKEEGSELNNMPIGKQQVYDAKLHSFVCSFTSSFESFLVKRVGRYKQNITLRAFTSAKAKNKTLCPLPYKASNTHRFIFVIPSLKLIYLEGWDFTHHVYFKNQASIDALKEEAAKAGVYVL